MKTIIIAAVSQNNVIGSNNNIPWENKEELKYFKETTINHAVLMGRKTFESIGKSLPKRFNLVVSRKTHISDKRNNLFYFTSVNKALEFAEKSNIEKTFIVGGSDIYSQMINEVDELFISRMPFEIDGDKYFPKINSNIWKLKVVKELQSFKVEKYKKIINL